MRLLLILIIASILQSCITTETRRNGADRVRPSSSFLRER